jgi:hypothetical protein
MEKETADREPLSSFSPKRPFTERLFESFVGDISSTVGSYHVGQLDAEAFVKRLGALVKGLQAFTKNGSVEQVLSRAEMVILDGVCRDISAAAEGDVTGPDPVIPTEPEGRAEESGTRIGHNVTQVGASACSGPRSLGSLRSLGMTKDSLRSLEMTRRQ